MPVQTEAGWTLPVSAPAVPFAPMARYPQAAPTEGLGGPHTPGLHLTVWLQELPWAGAVSHLEAELSPAQLLPGVTPPFVPLLHAPIAAGTPGRG